MKTNKTNKSNKQKIKVLLFTMAMVSSSAVVFAQDDDLLAYTDEVLNSEQIDIDGSFERRGSAADRIAKLRKRLESQNEEMMHKKIENERIKSEKKLERKLRKAFTGQRNSDRVVVRQAAPQRVVAPIPRAKIKKLKRTAVIPTIGISQSLGDDNTESKVDFGVSIEHAIHENVTVGFGVGFSKLELDDRTSDNNFNNFNNFGNNQDTQSDVDYEYKRFNINLNSKFYFTGLDAKFRPYVGAGLGYNRVTISDVNSANDCVQDGSNFGFNNNSNCGTNNGGFFGTNQVEQDSELTDSLFSATASIGTNFLFNDFIGMNVNFSFTHFLNDAFNDVEGNTNNSQRPDEDNTRRIGQTLAQDDVASVSAGVVIKF